MLFTQIWTPRQLANETASGNHCLELPRRFDPWRHCAPNAPGGRALSTPRCPESWTICMKKQCWQAAVSCSRYSTLGSCCHITRGSGSAAARYFRLARIKQRTQPAKSAPPRGRDQCGLSAPTSVHRWAWFRSSASFCAAAV